MILDGTANMPKLFNQLIGFYKSEHREISWAYTLASINSFYRHPQQISQFMDMHLSLKFEESEALLIYHLIRARPDDPNT